MSDRVPDLPVQVVDHTLGFRHNGVPWGDGRRANRGGDAIEFTMTVGGMTQPSIATAHRGSGWYREIPDLLGVSWLVLCGIAFLVPALHHGSHIGTYDILSQMGALQTAWHTSARSTQR